MALDREIGEFDTEDPSSDEPLSNLDANLREEMRFEIRRLHDEFPPRVRHPRPGARRAMVTSDRIAVMNAGRLEQIDSRPRSMRAPVRASSPVSLDAPTSWKRRGWARSSGSTGLRCRAAD